MKLKTSDYAERKHLCPLIKDPPSADCYCIKMDSMSVQSAIHYCAKNYRNCDIFKESDEIRLNF
ncbi:MAG: hypothetical protein FJ264_00355 [Planctomycetes bacterium]|nr:hypothetical protein [Planctomycetota bacterium]